MFFTIKYKLDGKEHTVMGVYGKTASMAELSFKALFPNAVIISVTEEK